MRRTLEPAATRARRTGDEYSIVELFGTRQLEMKRHYGVELEQVAVAVQWGRLVARHAIHV